MPDRGRATVLRARVGVLFPAASGRAPSDPRATSFGRAALALASEGIDLVLGDELQAGALRGQVVRDGAWVQAPHLPIDAVYHRYPEADRPEAWARLQRQLVGLPVVNPLPLVSLCRDKLACQRLLEAAGVPQPEVVTGERAHQLLGPGELAFLKPRHGAFGEGVRRVGHADLAELPRDDGWILQRAVPGPPGWAGICVRVLVQRLVDRGWQVLPGAARCSRVDPVVNHARGAEVLPADEVLPHASLVALHELSLEVARALAAAEGCGHAGELGLDFVIDHTLHPVLIEVNGKPRGRLEALARLAPARFAGLAEQAACAPLRWAVVTAGR
jgi:glutathione synthase/RimK-type ligase-like ATP-grasp enzyme